VDDKKFGEKPLRDLDKNEIKADDKDREEGIDEAAINHKLDIHELVLDNGDRKHDGDDDEEYG
jgi:hypothetical protein